MNLAVVKACWHDLSADERVAVLRFDPDALDLAWRAAGRATRQQLVADWHAEMNAIWEPGDGQAARRPSNTAIQDVVAAFQELSVRLPGRKPRSRHAR